MGTEGRVGVVTGEGVVFTDQGEGLRGEVSIFDLYSSVTSWGRAKSAPLRPLRSRNAFWSVLLLFGEQERWAQSEHNFECVYVCVCVCVCEHMCVHLRITWPKNKMHVKKKKKIKKIRKATAAKYTQKRDLFWWYLQSLCEKERKGKILLGGEGVIYKRLWLSLLKYHFAFIQASPSARPTETSIRPSAQLRASLPPRPGQSMVNTE